MGSQKKRPVVLTAADREELVRVTTTGVHPASARIHRLTSVDNFSGNEEVPCDLR